MSGVWLLASCAATDTPGAGGGPELTEDQTRSLGALVCHWSVPHRTDGPSVGSAVILGGNKLLTCRHILPESAHGFRAEIDDRPYDIRPRERARIDGTPVEYEVVAAGTDTDSMTEDWAVLNVIGGTESPDLELPPDLEIVFDTDPGIRPDDHILLIGFPGQRDAETGPAIIHARVVDPVLISVPDEIICVDTAAGGSLEGMSGGAAVVWNADTHRVTIVGLYRGMRQLEGLGRVWSEVHTVRRLPGAALPDR
ncbi:MAG: serine protease family protein [Planctomycetota bacterium]